MPNTKSAKKRLRQSEERRVRNRSARTILRSQVRKVPRSGRGRVEWSRLRPSFQEATKKLDKAGASKLIHPNKAARLKSRLSKAIKKAKAHSDFSNLDLAVRRLKSSLVRVARRALAAGLLLFRDSNPAGARRATLSSSHKLPLHGEVFSPHDTVRVEDGAFHAGAFVVPAAVVLQDFGYARETDADPAGHRRLE